MTDKASGSGRCSLPTCSMSGQLKTFKQQAVKRILESAAERCDNETVTIAQRVLDSGGDQASIDIHQGCYCSYTSKDHVRRVAQKRKRGTSKESDEPAVRLRRSQVKEFQFKEQCLFCAEPCKSIDSKHPERWDRVIQCERKGLDKAPPFKDTVLQLCGDRNDAWSREVATRCHGAHDLPAVEAQYHSRCYDEFRKIPVHPDQRPVVDDSALKLLIDEMYANRKLCTWTSVELYDKYLNYGGQLTRKQMFTKLISHLDDAVVVLHTEGCASIVGFTEFVGRILKFVKVETIDEESEDALVRKISKEARDIKSNNKVYDLNDFTCTKTEQHTSPTLLRLVSKLVSQGEVTKRSLSLSQSLQYNITNTRNQTTLGLGVKLHHKFGSSDLIHILNEHGFVVSYDEVLRFRKSAAKFAGENAVTLHRLMGLTRTTGVIFGWYDNFDLLVSTPNGRRETHAMATEFQIHPAGIIETGEARPCISEITFPRLTYKQTKTHSDKTLPLLHYSGPKKVTPPQVQTSKTGISYADLCARQASLTAAQDKDTAWLNSLYQDPDPMEWNGFNNELARKQGDLKPASKYMFGPLIDAPPSHPDTILTTLIYMQKSLVDMGMPCIHLTMDMQLFAVTKQVCWNQPQLFSNVIVHPGGMHIIQSFLSCIAKLMQGSGLDIYVAAAYGGLTGIFNGKSWVKAMRAFRGVSTALLKRLLSAGPKTFDDIEKYLDNARLNPTGRHWVDNFLIPTLLVHQFERAEREGNIYLKHQTMARMMKYFFLAGHVQYARYLTQYLLEMNELHGSDAEQNLVCRHHDGFWNAVSADQFGEQTAIKIGKGSLKGMTLSPELVCEWIEAFPITAYVSGSLDYMYSIYKPDKNAQKQHKEELRHRRILDAKDRDLILNEVEKYPHPLEDKRPHLFNPVTGQIAPNDVNVADSIVIGEKMENNFISRLPGSFYCPISSPVTTMSTLKKRAKDKSTKRTIDIENIFLRLLVIGQQRQMELEPIFAYELCAVPASLIDEHGCLRKGSKSVLVKRLGVPDEMPKLPEITIVDVSQLFYHIVWPIGGNPSDLISSIQNRLDQYPSTAEKVVVFDKYQDVSAKDHERKRRAGETQVDYELSIASPLPKRSVVLKSKNNKRRLAHMLHGFVLDDNVSMDTCDDSAFDHDEADITMVSYVLSAAECGKKVIRVLSDDTDVFILLVYWVYRAGIKCKVQMERWDGVVLDINATCSDLGPNCLYLLAMHALTGCDTTSYPYGKGKTGALKTLLAGNFQELAVIGEVDTADADLIGAAKPFLLALYGQPPGVSISSARFKLYTKKKKSPKVMALPPTTENLMQHVLRTHLQVMLWKAADQPAPPEQSTDITQFGWKIIDGIPMPAVSQSDPAPSGLIDVIRCQCKVLEKKCATDICGCHKEHLSCTSYCNCCAETGCNNPYTRGQPICDTSKDGEEVSDDDGGDRDMMDLDEESQYESPDQENTGDAVSEVFETDDEWDLTDTRHC